jgi:hypothetical protein
VDAAAEVFAEEEAEEVEAVGEEEEEEEEEEEARLSSTIPPHTSRSLISPLSVSSSLLAGGSACGGDDVRPREPFSLPRHPLRRAESSTPTMQRHSTYSSPHPKLGCPLAPPHLRAVA